MTKNLKKSEKISIADGKETFSLNFNAIGRQWLVVALLFILTACSKPGADGMSEQSEKTVVGRWYKPGQVQEGHGLYQQHCSVCHKADASGTRDWKTKDANGNYPPPPLNGTAHTWHHPLFILRKTIREGGVPLGGVMPGFANQLNDSEIDAIIAWVQSNWSDEVYKNWQEIDLNSQYQQ